MGITTARVNADFMHIGFANNRRPRRPEARNHSGIPAGGISPEKPRANRSRVSLNIQLFFKRYGNTIKNAHALTGGNAFSGRCCLRQNLGLIDGGKSPQRPLATITFFNGIQQLPGNFQRCCVATAKRLRQVPYRAKSD